VECNISARVQNEHMMLHYLQQPWHCQWQGGAQQMALNAAAGNAVI
jgi:hypothetical protein